MKILKRATLVAAGVSAIYLIGAYIFSHTAFSYRTWVDVSGKVLVAMVLPLLLNLLAGNCFCMVVKEKRGLKIFLGLAAAVVYLLWIYWAGLFIYSP